jgi:hypothetical protein
LCCFICFHKLYYFKYFDYPDFVTKDSGLIQIKKYADANECADLLEKIIEISEKTKEIILKGNRRLDIEWFS